MTCRVEDDRPICCTVGCEHRLGGPGDSDRFCADCLAWFAEIDEAAENAGIAKLREGQAALDAKEHGDAS